MVDTSAKDWWGSSIGSEQMSTEHQVVGSNPTLITKHKNGGLAEPVGYICPENRQTPLASVPIVPWCNGSILDFGSGGVGSSPAGTM